MFDGYSNFENGFGCIWTNLTLFYFLKLKNFYSNNQKTMK